MFLVSAVRNKTKFVFLKCKKKIRTLDRKNSAVIVICEFTILQSSYDTSNKKTILARVQDGIIITKFSVAVSFDTHTKKKGFDHFQLSATFILRLPKAPYKTILA